MVKASSLVFLVLLEDSLRNNQTGGLQKGLPPRELGFLPQPSFTQTFLSSPSTASSRPLNFSFPVFNPFLLKGRIILGWT